MREYNKNFQPFLMVLSATLILLFFSTVETKFKLFGFTSKRIEPLSEILEKGKVKHASLTSPVITDSIIALDSAAFALRLKDPANILDVESDSGSALSRFFKSLNETRINKNRTRIAYFGDSMIEGDLISQDLRSAMQQAFGGYGVGYLPVTSVVSGFRTSVIHSFEGWTTYNMLESVPAGHVLGISGYTFVPFAIASADTSKNSGSTVKYVSVKKSHIDKFYEAKLLYGKSQGENYVMINGSRYKLEGEKTVNQLIVTGKGPMQAINARFQCTSPVDVFGFSLESDSGVFVDNFSFRGNSGLPITKISQNVYSETDDCLGYDLIILEYGLNAVSPDVTDYSWYERGMKNVIKHIQASFPKASILLVSIGDRSVRKDGTYQTDASVPIMVETQRRLAHENKVAFWSLYEAMGGSGSMVKWVEGDTVYANKDYTHFNFKGAHRAGKLLYNKLMSEYNDYNKKNE
ncbi:MAG: hypothetical protein M3R27_00285 [Bacteroidota bacterium]|nr:hypothetical protein [Bacteroidota bacterium]